MMVDIYTHIEISLVVTACQNVAVLNYEVKYKFAMCTENITYKY